jgi:hypothetical protein
MHFREEKSAQRNCAVWFRGAAANMYCPWTTLRRKSATSTSLHSNQELAINAGSRSSYFIFNSYSRTAIISNIKEPCGTERTPPLQLPQLAIFMSRICSISSSSSSHDLSDYQITKCPPRFASLAFERILLIDPTAFQFESTLLHYLRFLEEWGNRFSMALSELSLGTFFSGDRYARSIFDMIWGAECSTCGRRARSRFRHYFTQHVRMLFAIFAVMLRFAKCRITLKLTMRRWSASLARDYAGSAT